MAKHVHEYGWIMQYPQGKIDITGYTFETWHYRYVGENWLMISMQVGSQGRINASMMKLLVKLTENMI